MEKENKSMKREGFGVKVDIKGNRCSRCGYEWVPHDFNDIPETCPQCRSPYWNKPKVRFLKTDKYKSERSIKNARD